MGVPLEFTVTAQDGATTVINGIVDSLGRLRDAQGKFVAGAKQAEDGSWSVGEAFRKTGEEAGKTSEKTSLLSGIMGGIDSVAIAAGEAVLTIAKYAGEAALAVGAAGAAFTAASIAVGKDFDYALTKVTAQMGATGAEAQALSDAARNIGTDQDAATASLAKFTHQLNDAGAAIASTTAAHNLAKSTTGDLASSTDLVSNALRVFGGSAADAERYAGTFSVALNHTTIEGGDLEMAMKRLGPIASSFGWSMEGTVASLMAFNKSGVEGRQLVSTITGGMTALAKGTDDAKNGLSALGISLESVNPQSHDLSSIINTLAHSSISAGDAMRIFGDTAGEGMFSVIQAVRNGRVSFDDMMKDVQGGSDSMKEINAKLTATVQGQWKIALDNVEEYLLSYYEMFKGPLEKAMEYVNQALEMGRQKFEQIGPTIMIVAEYISELAGMVWDSIKSVIEGVDISKESAMNAGYAIIDIITTVIQTALKIGDVLVSVVSMVADVHLKVIQYVENLALVAVLAISKALTWVDENTGGSISKIVEYAQKAYNWTVDMLNKLTSFIKDSFGSQVQAVVDAFNWLMGGDNATTPKFFTGAIAGLEKMVDTTGLAIDANDNMKNSVDSWTSDFSSKVGGVAESAKTAGAGIVDLAEKNRQGADRISNSLGTLGNHATSAMNAMTGALENGAPAVDSAMGDIGAAMQGPLSSMVSMAGDYGSQIGGAIADGIISEADRVRASFAEMAAMRDSSSFSPGRTGPSYNVQAPAGKKYEWQWGAGMGGVGNPMGGGMVLVNDPSYKKMATGGIVTSPTLAMIGEAGPEAVVPLGRGGAGGLTINLTVQSRAANDAAKRAEAREWMTIFMDEAQRRGYNV
jgi:TP901 family phage tail tape measure protein